MRGREGISSGFAHGVRYQVPRGLGDEVSLPGVDRGYRDSDTGRDPADLHGSGDQDSQRACEPRPRASVRIVPAGAVGVADDAIRQGQEQPRVAERVFGIEAAVLGPAPLGAGLLLRLVGHGDGRDDQGVYRAARRASQRWVYGDRREALADFSRRAGFSRIGQLSVADQTHRLQPVVV
jgi:hypothetical protein